MNPCRYTAINTHTLINAGVTVFGGYILTAGGVNATLIIYDGVDSNGTPVAKIEAPPDASSVHSFVNAPVLMQGLYAALNGTGAKATLLWEK